MGGGIGATIASLLDIGWEPMRPDLWVKPKENAHEVPSIAVLNHKQYANIGILEAVEKDGYRGAGVKLKSIMEALNWEKGNLPLNLSRRQKPESRKTMPLPY